jgi:hypothetical protein
MNTNIKVAIFENDIIKRDIIKEILDKHGILYDICDERCVVNYPCIISSEKIDNLNKNLILIEDNIFENYQNILTNKVILNEEDQLNAILSQYEYKLINKIRGCFSSSGLPFIRKWYWPNFKKGCIMMTHDIDLLDNRPSFRKSKRSIPLSMKAFIENLKYFINHLLLKPYGDFIGTLLNIEESYSIKSTYFVFFDYKDKKLSSEIINKIEKSGHEIGLHGSLKALSSQDIIKYEKYNLQNRINQNISGFRQHNLDRIFSLPDSLDVIDPNFLYDISIVKGDNFGYMTGICHPYHPINSLNEKLNILEIPSPFMDWTVLQRKYNKDKFITLINKIKSIVDLYNGCIVFSIHNTYINKYLYPEVYDTFLYILNTFSNDEYWITTGYECLKWWKKRENAKIDVFYKNNEIIGNSDTMLPIQIEYNNKITNLIIDQQFKIHDI